MLRTRQAWVACGGSFIRNVHTMVGFNEYNLNNECLNYFVLCYVYLINVSDVSIVLLIMWGRQG